MEVATERAVLLFGCYRKGEANDPDIYAGAVALMLTQYPVSVVLDVTSPLTGIAAKSIWLPSVAEVREACEEAMGPIDRQREQRRVEREQFESRTALDIPAEERERVRAGLQELSDRLNKEASDRDQEMRGRVGTASSTFNAEDIEASYRAAGQEPQRAGGMLVSRSLLKNLGARDNLRPAKE